MKCSDAVEMLNSYFDNKTDPMQDKLLAKHIKSCSVCRAELDFLIKYKNILKAVKPVSPPSDFLFKLHRKIDLETAENPIYKFRLIIIKFFNNFRFPLEAAGVLAAAAIIFFLYKPFFNEKIQMTSDEYEIESPRREISGNKSIQNNPAKSAKRNVINKHLPENETSVSRKNIKKDKPAVIAAVDDNSVKESMSDYDLSSTSKTEKSPSAEREKSLDISKEESNTTVALNSKKIYGAEKISTQTPDSDPENLFRKYEVSIIKKDVSDNGRLYYRIKVLSIKHKSLIQKLKESFIIDKETIIIKEKPHYEIELFLKKNKN